VNYSTCYEGACDRGTPPARQNVRRQQRKEVAMEIGNDHLLWVGTALLLLVLCAAAAVIAIVVVRRRKRGRHDSQDRIAHLAAEIIDVARSIEQDLRELPRTTELADLAARCKERRQRAQEATSRWRSSDPSELADRLHDDHWRMVNLRSELDSIMSGRRREKSTESRSCKFATGSKPVRSRFSTSTLSRSTTTTTLD
jgi:hypothetical protein